MRDELIAQGCTEKRNQRGTAYFESSTGKRVAKVCRQCDEVVMIEGFTRAKLNIDGRRSECKPCASEAQLKRHRYNPEAARKRYKANPEKYIGATRTWQEDNPDKVRGYTRNWQAANPDRRTLANNRRRARRISLPHTMTYTQWQRVVVRFGGKCAITDSTTYEKEHALPLSIGHGGTTIENMYPLRADLNASKGPSHIFEWFEWAQDKYDLSQRKFDELIAYLAEANEMTTQEYRMYTDWCFDNPNRIEGAA